MATERVGCLELTVVSGLIVLVESLMALVTRWAGEVPAMILIGAGRVVEIGLIYMVFRSEDGDAPAIGLRRGEVATGLFRGLLWAVGFGLLVATTGAFMALAGHSPLELIRMRVPGSGGGVAVLFLVGGLVGPVAEECYFRGVLFGFLRRWGAPAAVTVSTACFVLLHPGFGIIQAVGGLLFAISYEVEKSLCVPVVIHVAGNMALFSLSFIG